VRGERSLRFSPLFPFHVKRAWYVVWNILRTFAWVQSPPKYSSGNVSYSPEPLAVRVQADRKAGSRYVFAGQLHFGSRALQIAFQFRIRHDD
jgi:hypothetical protein